MGDMQHFIAGHMTCLAASLTHFAKLAKPLAVFVKCVFFLCEDCTRGGTIAL